MDTKKLITWTLQDSGPATFVELVQTLQTAHDVHVSLFALMRAGLVKAVCGVYSLVEA